MARIIRDALGLSHSQTDKAAAARDTTITRCRIDSVILEGEMVAYDTDGGIDGEAQGSFVNLCYK